MTITIRRASTRATCSMPALAMTTSSMATVTSGACGSRHQLDNKVALYNFLSTFSGTHFVTPRTYTAELGFHF